MELQAQSSVAHSPFTAPSAGRALHGSAEGGTWVREFLRLELARFFEHRGVSAWIGTDVMIVQGDVALHADVAITLGADPRPRRAWVRDVEGRSIDVAFRIVSGRSRLGAITSAARHVELGAKEAFAFHPHEATLWGFHRARHLVDAIPRSASGGLRSHALDADLQPLPGRVRVLTAGAQLSVSVERLERAVERAIVAGS
jgi:hypothetical protein